MAHPHPNASPATGDPHGTALQTGIALGNLRLIAAINDLIGSFRRKSREFDPLLQTQWSRLESVDRLTVGQQFTAFADTLAGEVRTLKTAAGMLCSINAEAEAAAAIPSPPDPQAFFLYSSSMQSLAITLSNVCSDLRLLSFGRSREPSRINRPPVRPAPPIVPREASPIVPVIAACIFEAQTTFIEAIQRLRVDCVDGITVSSGHLAAPPTKEPLIQH